MGGARSAMRICLDGLTVLTVLTVPLILREAYPVGVSSVGWQERWCSPFIYLYARVGWVLACVCVASPWLYAPCTPDR